MPKDSTRLSISGCARGRVFTVGRDPEHETSVTLDGRFERVQLEALDAAGQVLGTSAPLTTTEKGTG